MATSLCRSTPPVCIVDMSVLTASSSSRFIDRKSSTRRGERRGIVITMLPSFSVVIPAFNEASRIGQTVRATLDYLQEVNPKNELILSLIHISEPTRLG